MKTDRNGDVQWAKAYDTHDYDDTYDIEDSSDIRSIVPTADGGYLMAGGSYRFYRNHSVYLIKTDTDGSLLRSRTIQLNTTDSDFASSIMSAEDGGFVLAGQTIYDKSPFEPYSVTEAFLLKVDVNGRKVWNTTIDKGFEDEIYVAPTKIGSFLVVGNIGDPNANHKYNDIDCRIYAAEVANNGTLLWKKTIVISDYKATSITGTRDGGFIIAARSKLIMGGIARWGHAFFLKLAPLSSARTTGVISFCPGLMIMPLLAVGCLIFYGRRRGA